MLDKIIRFANLEHTIRAAILNGSRASPSAPTDEFQDYDVIFIVKEVAPFVENQYWINQFGKLIIMQKPDEMDGIWLQQNKKFTFLMLFEDGNRIDLTFMESAYYFSQPIDSQSRMLVDKDNLLNNLPSPSDNDYFPKPPSEKLFADCCNEFLWCSQNVVKGIGRKELTYAKFMSENVLRGELIKLLIWYAGIQSNFSKNIGTYGKFLEKAVEPEIWQKFKSTYVGADYDQMWHALFELLALFNILAIKISEHFGFKYDQDEYQKVLKFLKSKQS